MSKNKNLLEYTYKVTGYVIFEGEDKRHIGIGEEGRHKVIASPEEEDQSKHLRFDYWNFKWEKDCNFVTKDEEGFSREKPIKEQGFDKILLAGIKPIFEFDVMHEYTTAKFYTVYASCEEDAVKAVREGEPMVFYDHFEHNLVAYDYEEEQDNGDIFAEKA